MLRAQRRVSERRSESPNHNGSPAVNFLRSSKCLCGIATYNVIFFFFLLHVICNISGAGTCHLSCPVKSETVAKWSANGWAVAPVADRQGIQEAHTWLPLCWQRAAANVS